MQQSLLAHITRLSLSFAAYAFLREMNRGGGRGRHSTAALKLSGLSSSLLRLTEDLHPPRSPQILRASQAVISYLSMTLSSPTNLHPTLVSQLATTGAADRSPSFTRPVLPWALLRKEVLILLSVLQLQLPRDCLYQVTIWISDCLHPIACTLNSTSILNLVTRGKLGVKCYHLSSSRVVHNFSYGHKWDKAEGSGKLDQKF